MILIPSILEVKFTPPWDFSMLTEAGKILGRKIEKGIHVDVCSELVYNVLHK